MPIPPPVQKDWTSPRALLLVHGVGDYQTGDYADLLTELEVAVGPGWSDIALYELYYDGLNDRLADKTQAAAHIASFAAALRDGFGRGDLGKVAAEGCGDVLWPIMSRAARQALREFYLRQLKQIVDDGFQAGYALDEQEISIMCHSLGCFHTYEALCEAAREPRHVLGPAVPGVRFKNVIFVASPVQLIRHVATSLGGLVPASHELALLHPDGLRVPAQVSRFRGPVACTDRWVSITGNLDPVGGYLFRDPLAWGVMNMPGQESFVDDQSVLGIPTEAALTGIIRSSLTGSPRPNLPVTNPHSWTGYVRRNAGRIQTWLA